jgi:hypothetical protein
MTFVLLQLDRRITRAIPDVATRKIRTYLFGKRYFTDHSRK